MSMTSNACINHAYEAKMPCLNALTIEEVMPQRKNAQGQDCIITLKTDALCQGSPST